MNQSSESIYANEFIIWMKNDSKKERSVNSSQSKFLGKLF